MNTPQLTIHVLGYSDLFQHILNFIAAFMKGTTFETLLKLTTLISIIMLMTDFVRKHDPLSLVKWLLGFVFVSYVIILPKTTVFIQEPSLTGLKKVDNVPLVFALTTSLITNIGYYVSQDFDELLTFPDDLKYTQTGMLFGSQLILAANDFRVTNPKLKEELDNYFRSCVVGDIRLNKKYSLETLKKSSNIWETMTQNPSPLRMTKVDDKLVTCLEASKESDSTYSLYKRLQTEINQSYRFFGINLFGSLPKDHPEITYQTMFETHLTSAFNYYQNMTDASSNIFLQAMMINHIDSAIQNYKAYTDSSAGILNHQFTKTQMQHRWSWQIAGLKAAWFLPLLHTILTLLLFGIFPILIALGLLPSGGNLFWGYIKFFVSLQLWPLMFAILNAIVTAYGQSLSINHGEISMINLDKIDEIHMDLSGVAGYMMLSIPFIANGIVGRIGDSFNNLATSLTGHMQNSAMAIAGEVTNASFSLGQNSFYNTSANNFSANKHDSNWTDLHGLRTSQFDTGALKTTTQSGDTVYDTSPAMSKTPVGIADSHALSASLSKAYDDTMQSAQNESEHFQKALSSFAHKAVQFSALSGNDTRLGDGVSSNTSAQIQSSLTKMDHIATDVAAKLGITKEGAYSELLATSNSVTGGVAFNAFGVKGGVDAQLKSESTKLLTHRYSDEVSGTLSGKEAEDFNHALSEYKQLTQTHHFDETTSKGASLVNQMGADLRESLNASHNYDASLSKSHRISEAKNYVDTQGAQVTTDLSQAFQGYLSSHMDESTRDALISHPGDLNALTTLRGEGEKFMKENQSHFIEAYSQNHEREVTSFYNKGAHEVGSSQDTVSTNYQIESQKIQKAPEVRAVKQSPLNDSGLGEAMTNHITKGITDIKQDVSKGNQNVKHNERSLMDHINDKSQQSKPND